MTMVLAWSLQFMIENIYGVIALVMAMLIVILLIIGATE